MQVGTLLTMTNVIPRAALSWVQSRHVGAIVQGIVQRVARITTVSTTANFLRQLALVAILSTLFSGQCSAFGQDASLEMKQVGGKIAVVKVQVNGKDRRFIIDTGSQVTVVSSEVAGYSHDKLKSLKQAGTFQSVGVAGGAKAVFAKASFVLGRFTITDKDVLVEDFSGISGIVGELVDGLLGQDMLARFSTMTFDYKHHVLNLSK